MDKQEKIITIVTVALLVLIALVILLVWGAYSNWFTTDFEFIYLKSGGERLQQAEIYRLGNVKLDVRQFGGKRGYSVKIFANSTEDFTYVVDGKYYNYIEKISDTDLTEIFDVRCEKNSIFIHAKDLYVLDVLKAFYPDEEVAIVSEPEQPVLYKLIVTDNSGKNSFELQFHCRLSVTDIEVDPDHVYAQGVLPCVS